jgi:hypothetical protein
VPLWILRRGLSHALLRAAVRPPTWMPDSAAIKQAGRLPLRRDADSGAVGQQPARAFVAEGFASLREG